MTEFRLKLFEIFRSLKKSKTKYIITIRNKPAAVLIDCAEWESLRETLEICCDQKLMRQITRGRAYFHRGGKGKDHRTLFKP